MKKDLLTDLSNQVMKSMSRTASSKSDSGIPRQPDGSVDYDTYIPVVFKHLNDSLKPKHFDTKYDNRSKSNVESAKYREDGNKCCFGKAADHQRLTKALESYTRSIALALPGSQELALAHGNRSAVLLHLNRPEECLVEIDRAIKLGYPEKLKYKLLICKGECYAKLATESHAESRNWKLNAATKKDPPNEGFEKLTFALKDGNLVPPIASPSKKFPCASSAVDVNITTLNGRPYRRLVATRAINVGEVLIVEKPYFNWLFSDKRYEYCSYCLDFAWECLPCGACKNVVYCSETCQAAAWAEYHEIECPVYGLLIQYPSPHAASHGVRLLMQLCVEAGGLQELKRRVDEFINFTSADPLRTSDEWYQKRSLESILSLITNERELLSNYPKCIKETVQLAACSLFLIASRTKLFGKQCHSLDKFRTLMNDQDVLFFAKLLVKLALIAVCNIGPSSEEEGKGLVTKGFIISPFVSFQNHSCCPNSVLQFKKDHVVFHSIAVIKKGEEVTLSYSATWYMASRQDRHNFLRSASHFFTCSCQACEEDWPTIAEIASSRLGNFIGQEKIHPSKRNEAAAVFRRCLEPYVCKAGLGNLENKDKMLTDLQMVVRFIYENNCAPCYELGFAQTLIAALYSRTSNNSSKLRKNLAGT